jgi:hypothetical protein
MGQESENKISKEVQSSRVFDSCGSNQFNGHLIYRRHNKELLTGTQKAEIGGSDMKHPWLHSFNKRMVII